MCLMRRWQKIPAQVIWDAPAVYLTPHGAKDLDYRLVLKFLKSSTDVNQSLPPGVAPLYKAAMAGTAQKPHDLHDES